MVGGHIRRAQRSPRPRRSRCWPARWAAATRARADRAVARRVLRDRVRERLKRQRPGRAARPVPAPVDRDGVLLRGRPPRLAGGLVPLRPDRARRHGRGHVVSMVLVLGLPAAIGGARRPAGCGVGRREMGKDDRGGSTKGQRPNEQSSSRGRTVAESTSPSALPSSWPSSACSSTSSSQAETARPRSSSRPDWRLSARMPPAIICRSTSPITATRPPRPSEFGCRSRAAAGRSCRAADRFPGGATAHGTAVFRADPRRGALGVGGVSYLDPSRHGRARSLARMRTSADYVSGSRSPPA